MVNQRNIGFVLQNYALFPHLTVFENVAYGLRVKRMAEAEVGMAVHEVLQLVGLGGYDRQFPNQLSGGEQQGVALARAIVIRPRVLLFDEPLSNLDAKLRVHMRRELQQVQKQLSTTAVYVTHDQEEAMAISDRIVVMNEGAIAQEGTAESLYREPASEFAAQFIGRTNLLTARVLGVEAEATTLQVGGMRLRLAGRSPHAQPGRSVRLVVRPEVIGLDASDRTIGLPGTVVSRMFLGEKVEYHVRAGQDLVQVTRYNPGRVFAPNEAVTLTLPTDGIQGDISRLEWLRMVREMRSIAHIDMDAFYAAVEEERYHPELRGRPVVVGADPKDGKGRGVVTAAELRRPEVRIRSALPISRAWRLAEVARKRGEAEAVFVRGNRSLYREVSDRIMAIIAQGGDAFEEASIDEAYVDISSLGDMERAEGHAQGLKTEILAREGVSCSVGIRAEQARGEDRLGLQEAEWFDRRSIGGGAGVSRRIAAALERR